MVWNTEDREVDWDIDELDEIDLDVLENKSEDLLNVFQSQFSDETLDNIRLLINIERELERRE